MGEIDTRLTKAMRSSTTCYHLVAITSLKHRYDKVTDATTSREAGVTYVNICCHSPTDTPYALSSSIQSPSSDSVPSLSIRLILSKRYNHEGRYLRRLQRHGWANVDRTNCQCNRICRIWPSKIIHAPITTVIQCKLENGKSND